MPYYSRLVDGYPLHVVLVLLKFAKYSKLISLLVKFKLLAGEPNRQRPCGKPKVLPPNIVVDLYSALWPGLLFLHCALGWLPAPWLQEYVVLHQVGCWNWPYFPHLGTILPLYLLAAPAPPEWPNFMRMHILDLRFLSPPWRFLMALCSAMLSGSLAERRLAYKTTCSVRVLFDVVRLVTAAQSSAVACEILENAADISIALFAVPVWYPSFWKVC